MQTLVEKTSRKKYLHSLKIIVQVKWYTTDESLNGGIDRKTY